MRIIEHPSPNHDARPGGRAPDMLVIHYTGMRDLESALERLCDRDAKVSAHYLVAEDGRVFRLVAEERRAWHAGVAQWEGERDVNGRSIGIELENPGHEFGYRPFPEAQIHAFVTLAGGIVRRHGIRASRIVGHADVAPLRKADPGELFPWRRLAREAGIGLWVAASDAPRAAVAPDEPGVPDEASALDLLARFGYGLPSDADARDDTVRAVVRAFQRHFRPARIDGRLDAQCRAILARLVMHKARETAPHRVPEGRRPNPEGNART